MNGQPLWAGDPRVLGAFTIHSRLAAHAAGTVFLGRDREQQQVALVVLDPAAAADSAVRDRFDTAVAALAQQGKVRGAEPRGPLGWAALVYDAAGTAEAVRLLDAAGLTSAEPGAEGGPAFVPHWSGGPEPGWSAQSWSGAPNYAMPHPPGQGTPAGAPAAVPAAAPAPLPGAAAAGPAGSGPPSRTPLVAGLVGAVVLLAVVVTAVVIVITRSPGEPQPAPPTASGPIAQPPTTSAPPPTPTPTTSTPARDGDDGPPGPVAGPTYGEGEKKYHMTLQGMPFEFDAPGTWGCMRRDQAPFSSRWICIDEGGTFPPTGSGAGGLVAVQTCPSPCGPGQRRDMRKQIVVEESDWRKTDATTLYAEIVGKDSGGKRVVRVAMSHVFAARGGGSPDTAVAVQLTGPPDQKQTMQKLINEIRKRTP